MDDFESSQSQPPGVAVRTEKDSLGEVAVPLEAKWGAQSQRALENFPYRRRLPFALIQAIAIIKQAAAETNQRLGLLVAAKSIAIQQAAQTIIEGAHAEQFPVDIYQTGSGTSTNMNANEVIARLCQEQAILVHPNDDVNLSQSSNDTFPSAIHISNALAVDNRLLPAIDALRAVLEGKASQYGDIIKTGRTHLMDAMPVTLGQVFHGWLAQLEHAEEKIRGAMHALLRIPQGGTAVGNGVNCPEQFPVLFCQRLSEKTGHHFQPMDSSFAGQGALDRPLALSAALRGYAVVLTKISNDLRWMNSGPLQGLAEIQLPPVQPGSSIMPGKVNPVICESVGMVAVQVHGLDQAIALAAQSGNFELNVMMPLVAANLLEMSHLLSVASDILAHKAIAGLAINRSHLRRSVARNPMLVTALSPLIGYEKAGAIARQAYASGQSILQVALEQTDISREELEKLLDPAMIIGQK